ncbi:vegetative incompatibility protein HET-E-1 [Elysia marginata]|uniref:Vegetative incompatibility protein HET-E-1 n=1 Tax=Elysia marginata TaxID=1093978 RepID=A0AAV4EDH5_9GAST|nr:vegetative incompatibility protein HET-E-1 [Elysia marginata]
MAMEKQYVVRDTHTRSITAVGYNSIRREIALGCEDGVVKSYEAESGKLVQSNYQHKGWVTDFLFWADAKLLLSSSNDAQIIAWGSGGGAVDVIPMNVPIYCMAINPRRQQLVCGVNEGVHVYALDEEKESGHYINNKLLHFAKNHTDIVRCILCHESRIYSAGLLTGSFDKCLKIWSIDGKLIHKLDTFLSTVSGICYVPRNKTIWAAGGTFYASMFDPKSGDNLFMLYLILIVLRREKNKNEKNIKETIKMRWRDKEEENGQKEAEDEVVWRKGEGEKEELQGRVVDCIREVI